MVRVAGLLGLEERRALATLEPGERVTLALRLGARDLEPGAHRAASRS